MLNLSKEYIRWMCLTPNYSPELHFAIRNEKNNKIMATIFGMPKRYLLNLDTSTTIKAPDMVGLCVHKKLRSKKMANVLIQEMARRLKSLGF